MHTDQQESLKGCELRFVQPGDFKWSQAGENTDLGKYHSRNSSIYENIFMKCLAPTIQMRDQKNCTFDLQCLPTKYNNGVLFSRNEGLAEVSTTPCTWKRRTGKAELNPLTEVCKNLWDTSKGQKLSVWNKNPGDCSTTLLQLEVGLITVNIDSSRTPCLLNSTL